MRKSIHFIWWILLALVILIQFYPCKIPDSVTENPKDLLLSEQIPEEISVLLKGACYDCHSNETTYPFYSYVAPFKWLITRDINLGRADLNFSEWGDLKKREKIKVLSEIAEEVEEGNMPFPPYKITHAEARLTDNQIKGLIAWTEGLSEKIMAE